MIFDDFKVAMVCDLFFKLLEFDPDDDGQKPESKEDKRQPFEVETSNKQSPLTANREEGQQQPIEFMGEGIDRDTDFELRLKHKLGLFKTLIMQQIHEPNPVLNINPEDASRIVDYGQRSYFKHLRLYEYVFNNKQASEIKRINFVQEQTIQSGPLQQALCISKGRQDEKRSGAPRPSSRQEGEMSGFGGMDSHQNMSSTGREMQEDPYGEEEGEADMEEQDAEPEQMDLNQEDSS